MPKVIRPLLVKRVVIPRPEHIVTADAADDAFDTAATAKVAALEAAGATHATTINVAGGLNAAGMFVAGAFPGAAPSETISDVLGVPYKMAVELPWQSTTSLASVRLKADGGTIATGTGYATIGMDTPGATLTLEVTNPGVADRSFKFVVKRFGEIKGIYLPGDDLSTDPPQQFIQRTVPAGETWSLRVMSLIDGLNTLTDPEVDPVTGIVLVHWFKLA